MGDEFDIAEPERKTIRRPGRRRLRQILLIVVPVIAIVGALAYYLHGGRYESTDNAYVQSGRVAVSANVAGRVIAVEVHENQAVKKGDVLFRLDPAPFQATVDEVEAALATARQQVSSTRATYSQGQSEIQAAQDRLTFASRELARQRGLLAEGIASQAQYDQAALNVQQARQAIQTARSQNQSVLANLSGRTDLPTEHQPEVRRAQAALERARLNLGYTVVRAAQDGVVTKVTQLQVGNYINASQPVFSLVGKRIWIEANFKEDQLAHMRLGQPVTIEIDAFPDLELTGRVTSFSPGTGNSFSVLPAENATGNWVKVVQRLPVEITLDRVPGDVPLHAGLSAEAIVDTGYQRHLFGPGTHAKTAAR